MAGAGFTPTALRSDLSSPPLSITAYWPGWKIARMAKALPGSMPQSGAVLDGWGGLHSYGAPIRSEQSAAEHHRLLAGLEDRPHGEGSAGLDAAVRGRARWLGRASLLRRSDPI